MFSCVCLGTDDLPREDAAFYDAACHDAALGALEPPAP